VNTHPDPGCPRLAFGTITVIALDTSLAVTVT
jgi:hypothetical protein